jgi:uncharacterized protein (TIGR02145 family)
MFWSWGVCRLNTSTIKQQTIMKKPIFTFFTLAFIGLSTANAQVGVGTNTPDASAALEVQSTTQGFLPPRMTETDRQNINNPATGLMIYCTNCGTDGELQVYNGTDWTNIVGGATSTAIVTNPTTGKIWMDRNLGATQVATSSTDIASYGDYYQWGRAADGHQISTSPTTTTLSSTDTPGHGDFITINSVPNDWRNPQNNTLWQGVNAVNNPCPSGYRLPTDLEWDAERLSWSSNNAAGAFASPLKLPVAGNRDHNSGLLGSVGAGGLYWSSTVSSYQSIRLYFDSSTANVGTGLRAYGRSVRCLKN